MKKIGLLCLALVLALGTLGVGYAAWTDQITISGTVNTGTLCFSIEPGTYEEVGGCPDKEFGDWVYDGYTVSCPMGYHFTGIVPVPHDKCIADVTLTPIYDDDDNIVELQVTINDAYPYFVADISFYVCNCGTVPIRIKAPVIEQSNFLLIQYGDNIGTQLHPGQCVEISFKVGVTQHEGYEDPTGAGWIIDDPQMPLCPQNTPLSFTIDIEAIQFDEY